MFGHTVVLNFDQKGDTHTTFAGGLFSIVIRIMMTVYIALKFKTLIMSEGDNDITVHSLLFQDIGETEEVPYSATKLVLIPNIRKVRNGHEPLVYDLEAKKHIELRFSQHTYDYDNPKKVSETAIIARPCTEKDFSFS